jgi:hypothetical protein
MTASDFVAAPVGAGRELARFIVNLRVQVAIFSRKPNQKAKSASLVNKISLIFSNVYEELPLKVDLVSASVKVGGKPCCRRAHQPS